MEFFLVGALDRGSRVPVWRSTRSGPRERAPAEILFHDITG